MDNANLEYIWSKQKEFNKNFVDFGHLTSSSQQSLTKEYVLHLISETSSLLDEVNWKMHHKDDSVNINRRELVLEWIDIFKYWLSIGLVWDISPEEFFSAFDEKSDLVEQRYLQEFSSYEGKDIVICDIDGVLGDYPKTFLEYVKRREKEKGRNPEFDTDDISQLDLYQYLEGIVSTSDLKEYKKEYRESGEIRRESVVPGARSLLSSFSKAGYFNILLTSRPFDSYRNLYLDTYIWLKMNEFKFDMLLNDNKKRDKITNLAGKSRVIVIDDDPKIILGLLGIDSIDKIYMRDRPYNRWFDNPRVIRFKDFDEILKSEGVVKI